METVNQSSAEVQAPNQSNNIPGAQAGETKAETMARMYKVNVDGQELEVDENELKRGYSHRAAADKRMQEASLTRKEAEQVLRLFKENPREAFKHLGKDARQFAEEIINSELQEAMLSPQEREMRHYKQELEKYQTHEKAARAQYEKEQYDRELARNAETLQTDIISTLETNKLPRNEKTVSRIAYYMQSAIRAGFENVKPNDVIEFVKKDYISELQFFMHDLSEDQIEAFLGGDNVKRIAKSTVSKSKMPLNVTPRSINENKVARTDDKKPTSPDKFFRAIRGR